MTMTNPEPSDRAQGHEPEAAVREAFVSWLRAYAGGGEHWRGDVLMGEHDIALALWKDRQREIDRLRAALLDCARQAERLKKPCGMDPEGYQAVRNGQYQNISTTAHVALGTIRGPIQAASGRSHTAVPDGAKK